MDARVPFGGVRATSCRLVTGLRRGRRKLTGPPYKFARVTLEGLCPMADAAAESYPRLRELLGEDGFKELARLIRTTYEANEQRRRRDADEPAPPRRAIKRRPPEALSR
jgi:hypothetical protein